MSCTIHWQHWRNLETRIFCSMHVRSTAKAAFATAVQFRKAAIKDSNRTCGYPSIVNVSKIAKGDWHLQAALLSLFTVKYGSIVIAEHIGYAEALPLYGSKTECIYRSAEADEGSTGRLSASTAAMRILSA